MCYVSARMPIPLELPLSKHFTKERIAEIDKYSLDILETNVRGLTKIRDEKITNWRKVYAGTPREPIKSFPWQNASNVVIQLVGSYSDQLTAKLVMAVMGTDPLWVTDLIGEWPRNENAEEQRAAVEEWLSFSGMEPKYLNLMEKYPPWIRTMVKYGLGAMKLLPELFVEQVAESQDASGNITFTDHIRHDGSVALPLLFEDFVITATQKELNRYPMVSQRAVMQRFEVERMLYDKSYNKEAVKKVLGAPDRQGPDRTQREIEDQTGAATNEGGPNSDQYDIYENYFPYNVNGKNFNIVSTIQLSSRTVMKRVFNWLPENTIPYVTARLGSDGERAYGFGFCEMLQDYQEEVTAIHNRRGDASTLSNTNLLRAGDGTQLDSNFSIYPNALVTGPEGSIEVIPLGRNANETIKDEQQTLQLATDRAGVGPSSSGAGAGTVSKKGQFTAMGAFPVMQEGNTRANLSITEFRTAHYQLGRMKLLYDAHFSLSEKTLALFGEQKRFLKKGLESVRNGKLYLPIRAATGSVNKEIEKQNLMLLLNNTRAHTQQVAQLLQAAANPQMPPELMHFILNAAVTSSALMRRICKDFGIEDPSSVVPDLLGIKEKIEALEKNQMEQKAQQIAAQMKQQQGGGGPSQPQLTNGAEQPPQGQPPPQGASPQNAGPNQ